MTGECQACGRALEAVSRPGRAAAYCSQACRQRAYRERQRAAGAPVAELLADIRDRLRRLRPTPALAFCADVEALSARVGTLRRLAREARADPAAPSAAAQFVTPVVTEPESVTPGGVTNLGDDAFVALTEEHRSELRVHCYRLLGSYDEAEDLTQEAFLRTWRARGTLAGVDNRS